ncbi:hypothetical protein [Nocardioides sp. CFH 31398]|uniref:hypothetical protein n=1 Tax=Nocardioides sp. CFH 31398 TaxID=2919579 RepID=UPI001F053233|nr:hypothetical protein [Nocardioides sp. CFH 31398]MCH1865682.1 hypothetical protein [Nocardioides sp. CFH 31398]
MRDRGSDEIGRVDRRAGGGLAPGAERVLVLVGAGLLLVAVGVFGYVLGEVPTSTTQTLLPLQLVGPQTFGWILTVAGVVAVVLASQPGTVRLGYGLVVGAFAALGAWFVVGWFGDVGGDTRPLASGAIYLFCSGALLVQARAGSRSQR